MYACFRHCTRLPSKNIVTNQTNVYGNEWCCNKITQPCESCNIHIERYILFTRQIGCPPVGDITLQLKWNREKVSLKMSYLSFTDSDNHASHTHELNSLHFKISRITASKQFHPQQYRKLRVKHEESR